MRVLLASPISPHAIDRLKEDHDLVDAIGLDEQIDALLYDRNVIIFRSGVVFSADRLRKAPELELVIRAGSGFDNIDLGYSRENGIRVIRIPAPSAQAVAEMTIGLILAASRHIVTADRFIRRGHWPKVSFGGGLLAGKTLGVVGAGNIGSRVAYLGNRLDMNVIGCVKNPPRTTAALPYTPADFDTVISQSDFVCIHTPLDDSTRGMIGATELGKMKPGAILVNMSRGGVVDETALLDSLQSGHLGAAALDVHEKEGEGTISPLAYLDNVVLTPHIGGMALESQHLIGERLLFLLEAHAEGRLGEFLNDQEIIV